jgi:hypothetical protein
MEEESMLQSAWGIVRNGKIELTEHAPLAEGSRLLITFLPSDDSQEFWLQASQPSLDAIWDNPHDEVYAELLKT